MWYVCIRIYGGNVCPHCFFYEHVLSVFFLPASLGLLLWWYITLRSTAAVGFPSMPLSTFPTRFWGTLWSRLLFPLLLLLLLWSLGRGTKKRALKLHSDNDQADTAMLKHACLNFYGPLKQYLWTKCNFKNPKHCITHYIIIRDQINPKQNQCYSPLAPLKPCCSFPWFRHQLVYAWCAYNTEIHQWKVKDNVDIKITTHVSNMLVKRAWSCRNNQIRSGPLLKGPVLKLIQVSPQASPNWTNIYSYLLWSDCNITKADPFKSTCKCT